ncbi:MAG: hypothetical protein HOO67_02370 [Candidatus Peribacteraceae bacterium]|nr:hypothetical protein [Candidatus Peribacteraceae bacterium]
MTRHSLEVLPPHPSLPEYSESEKGVLALSMKDIIEQYGHCTFNQSKLMWNEGFTKKIDRKLGLVLSKIDEILVDLCTFEHDHSFRFTPFECSMSGKNAACGHQGLQSARYSDGIKTFTPTSDNAVLRIEHGIFFLEAMGKGDYKNERTILQNAARSLFRADRLLADTKFTVRSQEQTASSQNHNAKEILAVGDKIAADIRKVVQDIATGSLQKTNAGIPDINKGQMVDITLFE